MGARDSVDSSVDIKSSHQRAGKKNIGCASVLRIRFIAFSANSFMCA